MLILCVFPYCVAPEQLISCDFPQPPKEQVLPFSVYRNNATSGVAKVLKDLKEVLGEPESRSSNLAHKLTHVGRHGNNYSSRGWVGGRKGKENLLSRPAPRESRELNIIPIIYLSP